MCFIRVPFGDESPEQVLDFSSRPRFFSFVTFPSRLFLPYSRALVDRPRASVVVVVVVVLKHPSDKKPLDGTIQDFLQ